MDTNEIFYIIIGLIVLIYFSRLNSKKDGRWNDSAVTKKRVIEALNKYDFTNEKYKTFKKLRQSEVAWNKDLEKHLKTIFLHVKRGSLSKPVEIDLDVGRGNIGIELKWADKINKKNPKNNVIGQIRDYHKDGNYKELILVVAGFEEEKHHPYLTDIKEVISNQYFCDYYFMTIKTNNS